MKRLMCGRVRVTTVDSPASQFYVVPVKGLAGRLKRTYNELHHRGSALPACLANTAKHGWGACWIVKPGEQIREGNRHESVERRLSVAAPAVVQLEEVGFGLGVDLLGKCVAVLKPLSGLGRASPQLVAKLGRSPFGPHCLEQVLESEGKDRRLCHWALAELNVILETPQEVLQRHVHVAAEGDYAEDGRGRGCGRCRGFGANG